MEWKELISKGGLTMRWLFTMTVAALAVPAYAGENDAEKLFRLVETKIQKAKTVQVRFDAAFTNTGVAGTIKGKVALGESDQVKFDIDMFDGGENSKLSLVGTGAKLFVKHDGNPAFDRTDSPKELGGYVRISMARFGASSLRGYRPQGRKLANVNDDFKVSDFKLGAKEEVAGAEAQVVEYAVVLKGAAKGSAKMWISKQTNLPAKLEMRLIAQGLAFVLSETYTEFALDGKLDAKLFAEPK
jgi:hypothetical protein